MSLLSVEKIYYSYAKAPVLRNISFDISEGEFVSVLGANGSGKSTLFSVMNGTLKPDSGAVSFRGRSIRSIPPRLRARELASVFQNTDCKFPFTCFEIAEMGLFPHKMRTEPEDIDYINDIMEKTDTIQFSDKLITELSGGEAQRVLLARALVQKPALLMLDEAMSGFDIAARIKMTGLLKDMTRERNMSVVLIRHDIESAFMESDRILALKNGELMYNGAPQKIMSEKFFSDIYGVKAETEKDRFYIVGTTQAV